MDKIFVSQSILDHQWVTLKVEPVSFWAQFFCTGFASQSLWLVFGLIKSRFFPKVNCRPPPHLETSLSKQDNTKSLHFHIMNFTGLLKLFFDALGSSNFVVD